MSSDAYSSGDVIHDHRDFSTSADHFKSGLIQQWADGIISVQAVRIETTSCCVNVEPQKLATLFTHGFDGIPSDDDAVFVFSKTVSADHGLASMWDLAFKGIEGIRPSVSSLNNLTGLFMSQYTENDEAGTSVRNLQHTQASRIFKSAVVNMWSDLHIDMIRSIVELNFALNCCREVENKIRSIVVRNCCGEVDKGKRSSVALNCSRCRRSSVALNIIGEVEKIRSSVALNCCGEGLITSSVALNCCEEGLRRSGIAMNCMEKISSSIRYCIRYCVALNSIVDNIRSRIRSSVTLNFNLNISGEGLIRSSVALIISGEVDKIRSSVTLNFIVDRYTPCSTHRVSTNFRVKFSMLNTGVEKAYVVFSGRSSSSLSWFSGDKILYSSYGQALTASTALEACRSAGAHSGSTHNDLIIFEIHNTE
ncbi:hypothetical protein DPMN_097267 [Dreissena polymorpha]|uniref:Uncharacterized protein n=1 Tax=Dreissena polymorpha TaxID=45954 RepID=A0A9D4LBH2_DREPO|nr:hypothetical protein DPMN_097267 [Dreissena polymorpha]